MRQLGPEQAHVATSYNNLGIAYRNLGDFQHAKDTHASALDIRLEQLGPDHVDVATSYNNLCIVYINLGDFQEAKESHARTLNNYVKQLRPDQLEVGKMYENKGDAHNKPGHGFRVSVRVTVRGGEKKL